MSVSQPTLSGAGSSRRRRKGAAAEYQRTKAKARRRSAEVVLAGQEIGPLPAVVDPFRRANASRDFRFFCETYFPDVFWLPWCDDHLRTIVKIEAVILGRESLAVAMPRGSGKTCLCIIAALWAAICGHHRFEYLVGASKDKAKELIKNLKTHLATNEKLLEDFPEVCYPLTKLEGEPRRCLGQRYYGVPTRITWSDEELVLPTIPSSSASGAVIRCCGITGSIRGAQKVLDTGEVIRPTLVICDDPQNDESARSQLQTRERLNIINGALGGLAGPGESVGIIIPCTVIFPDDLADQLLDHDTHPDWHGERAKMLYSFPTNEKLWGQYANLRAASLRADRKGEEATAFYKEHRNEMDEGAVVAWEDRYDRGRELSGLQHAMNLWLKAPVAFASEYQNEPQLDEGERLELTVEDVCSRVNGLERGRVPVYADALTMFVDVQGELLYYLVAAWGSDFTGAIVDYGSYPDQGRAYYTLRDAKRTLRKAAPRGAGIEGAIFAGLQNLAENTIGREWRRDDGINMRIDLTLVDANWAASTDVVYQFCRESKFGPVLLPAHGQFIGASNRPYTEYKRRKGEKLGHHWRIPPRRGTRAARHVLTDANYWKSFIFERLGTAYADPGALTLFGRQPARHRMIGEQLTAEFRVSVTGRGRTVDEWKEKSSKPDNHWFDCIVGAAVAASMRGCVLKATEARAGNGGGSRRGKRKRVIRLLGS